MISFRTRSGRSVVKLNIGLPINSYCLITFFLLATALPPGNAVPLPAVPSSYVVDLAGIIDVPTAQRLNEYLKELEQKTTAQFIVLTVGSLGGVPIEEFSLGVAEKWKLGQKGKDNGLLLVIAMAEGRYRFEVGYGLEAILPDAKVGSIGREKIVPNFRQGNYSYGVFTAVTAAADEIAEAYGAALSGSIKTHERRVPPRNGGLKDVIEDMAALFVLFFLGVFIYLGLKKPPGTTAGRGGGWSTWGGYSGGFGGGGAFGGGSGGAFGGGGGGAFGGGGASGGWK
jgi:uncharacterized protein